MFRRAGLVMAIVAAFAVPLLALSVPASAAADLRTTRAGLQVMATGWCLESNGAGQAYTTGCTGSSHQTWIDRSDGLLRNAATGLCLESNGGGGAHNTYTAGCDGSRYQTWALNGHRRTLSNAASGWCLNSDTHGRTFTTVCSGTDDQLWRAINLQRY